MHCERSENPETESGQTKNIDEKTRHTNIKRFDKTNISSNGYVHLRYSAKE